MKHQTVIYIYDWNTVTILTNKWTETIDYARKLKSTDNKYIIEYTISKPLNNLIEYKSTSSLSIYGNCDIECAKVYGLKIAFDEFRPIYIPSNKIYWFKGDNLITFNIEGDPVILELVSKVIEINIGKKIIVFEIKK